MVEWKKIGEIMTIVRGASPRPIKNFITSDKDGINWIKIGDVASDAKYITSSNERITKEGAEKSRLLHSGDFILSNSMSFGRPYILKIDGCIHDGWIAMSDFEKHITPGYLYEILNSNGVQDYWKMKANNGGAMTNLNSDIVRDTTIPIPSLSEQERIVGILDTFTASIDNLKEQIAQRRKQYEHYRDQLLDLEGKEGVEMKKLGEVCKIGDGLHGTPVYKDNGEYFFINGNNFCDGRIILKSDTKRVDETMFVKHGISLDKETILMSINGTIGNIAIYNNEKVILGKSAAYFKIIKRDVVCFRYIYYLLQTSFSKEYYSLSLTGSTIKNLGLKALREYVISIPTLQEQERIVSILDTFEASIQNLEAQLAERQKQYEYYREKLLTFE